MNIAEVAKLGPKERWAYWVLEREKIRVRRAAGQQKPWTDDEILRSYRFCNVRRMDDKVSLWLYDKWYTRFKGHPNMLPAVALARFINNPASLKMVQGVAFPGNTSDRAVSWNAELMMTILREYRDAGNTVFSGAYMVRGNNGIDKIDCVLNYYVAPLVAIKPDVRSMQACWNQLLPSFGMGSFMAGQIVADLRWAVTGQWKDRFTWAPMGPGSKRGLNRLLERDVKAPMGQEEFLRLLRSYVIDRGMSYLPESITGRLEAIDWQNTLCEYDKYSRVLLGEGRPKQKYPGEG